MTMNFNDVLNTKVNEIERPPLIPTGTYTAVVTKIPETSTSPDERWDFVDFQLRLIAADEDVDQNELTEYGGLNKGTITRRRFLFNKEEEAAFKRTLFDLRQFLSVHLGVEADDTIALKESLNNSVNHQCKVFMKWRVDKNNPEVTYSEISKTAPIA